MEIVTRSWGRKVRGRNRALAVIGAAALVAGCAVAAAPAAMANPAPRAPWDAYNYSPSSRTVTPQRVYRTTGTVANAGGLLQGRTTTLSGSGSSIVLDFGEEVGGLVTLHFGDGSAPGGRLGLAFSESSQYVGPVSDASNGGSGTDGAIDADVTPGASWTMPAAKLRGGFRYLTLFDDSGTAIALDKVSLAISFAPSMTNLRDYDNYFYSSDPLLNRVWYAGAYTVQTDTIASNTGRVWGPPATGWDNSATVGVGDEVLVDGAKRDRTVWPGDLGVAVPTEYASLGDLTPTRNALTTLYDHQAASGELPFAGPEVNFYGSDTYHLWTLIGTANYVQYSHDTAWLSTQWANYRRALQFSLSKVGNDGLMSVTGTNDWARAGQGGENIEANSLLYRALVTGAQLATVEGDGGDATAWTATATRLAAAINDTLWDDAAGEYRDNPGSTVHPQDGNSVAVWYGVAPADRAERISQALTANWNSYGATTPENGGQISTFPGSMEVQAHLQAGDTATALDLIRREWGYMLNSPLGTGSTFWEGYLADGSFGYGGAYMSNAHGWATGPTSALSFYVLGIRPTTVDGGYDIAPQTGDLSFTQGSLRTPLGDIKVSWTHNAVSRTFTETLDAPKQAVHSIEVPTYGAASTVTVNGRLVWDGVHGLAYGAHRSGDAVVLTGAPTKASIVAHAYGQVAASLRVSAPGSVAGIGPGGSATIPVFVSATGNGPVSGAVTAKVPSGWTSSTARFAFDTRNGPGGTLVLVTVKAPQDAPSGSYPLAVTATGSPRQTASTTVTVPLSRTRTLYDFEDGTAQGWQAGENVTSVAAVTSFANGPGKPHGGSYALEAAGAGVDASLWRTVSVAPASPLDLSGGTLSVWVDGYGGAPGATGYQARVVVEAGQQSTSVTAAVANDAWTQVRLDLTSFADAGDVTGIQVSFSPVGSTAVWPGRFDIDDVTWTDQPAAQ